MININFMSLIVEKCVNSLHGYLFTPRVVNIYIYIHINTVKNLTTVELREKLGSTEFNIFNQYYTMHRYLFRLHNVNQCNYQNCIIFKSP